MDFIYNESVDLYSAGLTLKFIFVGGKEDETGDQRMKEETKVLGEDEPTPFPKDKYGYSLVVSFIHIEKISKLTFKLMLKTSTE